MGSSMSSIDRAVDELVGLDRADVVRAVAQYCLFGGYDMGEFSTDLLRIKRQRVVIPRGLHRCMNFNEPHEKTEDCVRWGEFD
jgi:hypothetical protein